MLRAIFFDFDGVLADSEPIHFAMLQRVLGEVGIFLSKEEYYSSYLGYDDRGCFEAALTTHGSPISPPVIADLVSRKARVFLDHLKRHTVMYPGIPEFVREAATRYRLAIVSGALRQEIEFILEQAGIRKEFEHITSAEDVTRGKPHPEGFLLALTALNQRSFEASSPLRAEECLVIEDSIPGIRAGTAAGMRVLAVTTSHGREDLREADWITTSLSAVDLGELERDLWPIG